MNRIQMAKPSGTDNHDCRIQARIDELKKMKSGITESIEGLTGRINSDREVLGKLQIDMIGVNNRIAELMLLLEDKPIVEDTTGE